MEYPNMRWLARAAYEAVKKEVESEKNINPAYDYNIGDHIGDLPHQISRADSSLVHSK